MTFQQVVSFSLFVNLLHVEENHVWSQTTMAQVLLELDVKLEWR